MRFSSLDALIESGSVRVDGEKAVVVRMWSKMVRRAWIIIVDLRCEIRTILAVTETLSVRTRPDLRAKILILVLSWCDKRFSCMQASLESAV